MTSENSPIVRTKPRLIHMAVLIRVTLGAALLTTVAGFTLGMASQASTVTPAVTIAADYTKALSQVFFDNDSTALNTLRPLVYLEGGRSFEDLITQGKAQFNAHMLSYNQLPAPCENTSTSVWPNSIQKLQGSLFAQVTSFTVSCNVKSTTTYFTIIVAMTTKNEYLVIPGWELAATFKQPLFGNLSTGINSSAGSYSIDSKAKLINYNGRRFVGVHWSYLSSDPSYTNASLSFYESGVATGIQNPLGPNDFPVNLADHFLPASISLANQVRLVKDSEISPESVQTGNSWFELNSLANPQPEYLPTVITLALIASGGTQTATAILEVGLDPASEYLQDIRDGKLNATVDNFNAFFSIAKFKETTADDKSLAVSFDWSIDSQKLMRGDLLRIDFSKFILVLGGKSPYTEIQGPSPTVDGVLPLTRTVVNGEDVWHRATGTMTFVIKSQTDLDLYNQGAHLIYVDSVENPMAVCPIWKKLSVSDYF